MKKHFQQIKHICLSLAISSVLMAFLFPTAYYKFSYSPIRFSDTEFLYSGFFCLTQSLSIGRLQLWNSFDQMPLAFFYLTGMMTYTNALASSLFLLLQNIFEDTAKYFYIHYVISFSLIPAFIRTAGFYFLVKHFVSRPTTIITTTVLASTVFNPQYHLGLNCTSLYSIMPLLLHFLLCFLERPGLKRLIAFYILLLISISFDPLVALGYYYQVVHFVVVPGVIWLFVYNRRNIKSESSWACQIRQNVWLLLGTLALSLLIMLPWIMLLKQCYPDYELSHTTSRFANIFSVMEYFNRQHQGANPQIFFVKSLDFGWNQWESQWVFIGWSGLAFSIIGLVVSTDSRRLILFSAIALLLLLQFPRNPMNVLSLAHWINALTNPFNSVVRSAHMSGAFLVPTLLVPLFAIGLDSMLKSINGLMQISQRRLVLAAISVLLMAISVIIYLQAKGNPHTAFHGVIWHTQIQLGITVILLASVKLRLKGRGAAAIMMAGLMTVIFLDFRGVKKYLEQIGKDQMSMETHSISGLREDINPVFLDYQNPLLNSAREHYVSDAIGQVSPYLITDPINMQGLFFQYTNLNKYFSPATNYKPRHKSYAPLANDQDLQEYVKRGTAMAYVAGQAAKYEPGAMKNLLEKGLEREIVLLTDLNDSTFPVRQIIKNNNIKESSPPSIKWRDVKLHGVINLLDENLNRGFRSYWIELPHEFPSCLTSTVFGRDAEGIDFRIGDEKLVPAQGALTRAGQFDLQNIKNRRLYFSVASHHAIRLSDLLLRYKITGPFHAEAFIRHEPDSLEVRLNGEQEGWLVIHLPYDPKWRAWLNGVEQPLRQANNAFTAIRIQSGNQILKMEYWPHSYLRILIPLSIIASTLTLIGCLWVGGRLDVEGNNSFN